MTANQAQFSILRMCAVLGVSRAGFYASQQRAPSGRARSDAALSATIATIHGGSYGTYGSPRIQAELRASGQRVGRKRIARLMRAARIQGVHRRRGFCTTRREPGAQPAADLVCRDFTATAPNQLWVGDITYVPTGAGFLFLAVVIDVWSRRVVGWAMATHLRTELVLSALEMARTQRRPAEVVYHSDQGCQYTSFAYGTYCRDHGIAQSMGSVGDAYDNALCESFFATLECELLGRNRFANPDEARAAIFAFIEGWYNTRRRHSAIGYASPMDFERANASAHAAVA